MHNTAKLDFVNRNKQHGICIKQDNAERFIYAYIRIIIKTAIHLSVFEKINK